MFLILFSSRLHPYSIIVVNNTAPDNHARHTVHMNINDMHSKRDNSYENRSCGELNCVIYQKSFQSDIFNVFFKGVIFAYE